jgi:hypothetical protein
MKKALLVSGLVVIVLAILVIAVPVQPGNNISLAPRIHVKFGSSTNWAGYAVQYPTLSAPQNNMITSVNGTWKVPSVSTSPAGYCAVWVGIDGYSNGSVEQIGTEQDSSGNYYAWYEMYPKPSYKINSVPIKSGDSIYAEVKYIGKDNFTLTLNNISTKKTFSTTQKSGKSQCQSAEWIVEAPWSGGVLPLANFGTININGAYAIVNGNQAGVTSYGSDSINMVVSKTDATIKALTQPIDANNFSVIWKHK